MSALPLFPVTTVGSWPRPAWLLEARRRRAPELRALEDRAVEECLRDQEESGVDIVTDGEQRRDNFYSFLCDRVAGLRLMTLAELLDYVEDKSAFETLLRALDVPAFSIKNPTVVGRLERRHKLVLDDVHFLRERTSRPIKATLPGPYLLSRSAWVRGLSDGAYPTRDRLCEDIVRILREEMEDLAAAGVEMIQLDEPVLSEVVFAGKSATRTFMCAALAAQASPESELALAVDLVNRTFAGLRGPIRALHVCRGNWSTRESVLLSGSYDALLPSLRAMEVDQLVLEYATPRAGSLEALAQLAPAQGIGLGCVNPRTEEIESASEVASRARAAAAILGPRRVMLNPDCGFGTFADRPMASREIAKGKLRAMAGAAAELRRTHE